MDSRVLCESVYWNKVYEARGEERRGVSGSMIRASTGGEKLKEQEEMGGDRYAAIV